MTSLWQRWRLKSPASQGFAQPFTRAQIKENIKDPRHWPSCWEFSGDRWIPRIKGSVTRKMFPFDDVIMNRSSLAILSGYKSALRYLWRVSAWHSRRDCLWVPVPAGVCGRMYRHGTAWIRASPNQTWYGPRRKWIKYAAIEVTRVSTGDSIPERAQDCGKGRSELRWKRPFI